MYGSKGLNISIVAPHVRASHVMPTGFYLDSFIFPLVLYLNEFHSYSRSVHIKHYSSETVDIKAATAKSLGLERKQAADSFHSSVTC